MKLIPQLLSDLADVANPWIKKDAGGFTGVFGPTTFPDAITKTLRSQDLTTAIKTALGRDPTLFIPVAYQSGTPEKNLFRVCVQVAENQFVFINLDTEKNTIATGETLTRFSPKDEMAVSKFFPDNLFSTKKIDSFNSVYSYFNTFASA